MSAPEKPSAKLKSWFEIGEDGKEIARNIECGCGKTFTQHRVAFRFVESLAEGRGERAAALFMEQIPGGWVPVFCPTCERKDLNSVANRAYFPAPPSILDRRSA